MEELQSQRDAEEEALRAETRRREEELTRQRLAEKKRERKEQSRPISVGEERKRLESLNKPANMDQQYNYSQYANISSQPPADQGYPGGPRQFTAAPAPPERGSSYNVANQHNLRTSPEDRIPDLQNDNFRGTSGSLRPGTEKKSVSFNAQLETQISPSYRTPEGPGMSSKQNLPASNYNSYEQQVPAVNAGPNFNTPPQNHIPVNYLTSNTPGVIGAQEIYLDPRTRIEAQKNVGSKKLATDKMSFKEKMKYFAQEAGENTPQEKPKSSKSQRVIESQLYNGK